MFLNYFKTFKKIQNKLEKIYEFEQIPRLLLAIYERKNVFKGAVFVYKSFKNCT